MPEGSIETEPSSAPPTWSATEIRSNQGPTVGDLAAEAIVLDVEERMDALVRAHATDTLLEAALQHLRVPGRRIRVRLAAAAADALGVERLAMAPFAAAVELLHNATLVHDDLQDRDEVRRGQPTVWKAYGDAEAINVGDLLLMLPVLALDDTRTSPATTLRLTRAIHRAALGCVNGQSGEQSLLAREALTWNDWERSARGKTGHLFGLPVEGAALLAGYTSAEAAALGDVFADAGIVFQIVDDVLDLFGGHNGRGRGHGRRGGDVFEGRISALIVEYLARVPSARAEILALLRLPADETPPDDVRALAVKILQVGALEGVLDRVDDVKRRVLAHPSLESHPTLGVLCRAWISELTRALSDVDTDQLPARTARRPAETREGES